VDQWEAVIAIAIKWDRRGELKPDAICHGVRVSISYILCSELDLYSRFEFRPDFQDQKGLSSYA